MSLRHVNILEVLSFTVVLPLVFNIVMIVILWFASPTVLKWSMTPVGCLAAGAATGMLMWTASKNEGYGITAGLWVATAFYFWLPIILRAANAH